MSIILMSRIIKLDVIQKNTKKFYEICADIGILQRELEEMLIAIERNSKDFSKGKISKNIFQYNDSRLKKESAKIIKSINALVDQGKAIIGKIDKEIETQKIGKGPKNIKKVIKVKKDAKEEAPKEDANKR